MADKQEYTIEDNEFKHEDTTHVMKIRFLAGNRFTIYPDKDKSFVAKVGTAGGAFMGTYPVTTDAGRFIVKSADLKGLDVGDYRLEIWEKFTDSNGDIQTRIFPSPKAFVSFTINKNVEDSVWDLVRNVSFQDLVNTAVVAAGQNLVVTGTETLPAGSQANVVQAFKDGKNELTFKIPQGVTGSMPALHIKDVIQGEPGTQLDVKLEESDDGYNLSFVIPKGDPGYTPQRGKDYWTNDDVNTIKSWAQDSLKQELDSQIELSKSTFQPQAFQNEAALKSVYPSGASGIMITVDNGHKWLWIDGAWKDCGAYQSVEYPEVDEARTGAKSLGSKKYASLSEAIHRQVDGLSNLGNQEFSFPITGEVGKQVSLQSEYEVGAKAGSTLKVKFDPGEGSDLSVVQIWANGAWLASIEQRGFGAWQKFKLDKDIGTLGLVIPADKFSKDFSGTISFQIVTPPVEELQNESNKTVLYELPVSPSTDHNELKPEGIKGLSFSKGDVVFVRLKANTSNHAIRNYQFLANGRFLISFNDLNNWHKVALTSDTASLGFQIYKSSVVQDFNGTLQVVGSTLGTVYQDIDDNRQVINSGLTKLVDLSLGISVTPTSNDVKSIATENINLPKGSKIKIKFSADVDPSIVEGYQIYANEKFLISFQDINTWHDVTLPEDTTSLGYAFYKGRIHGDVTGTLRILGGSFKNLYDTISSETETRFNNQLTEAELAQLDVKEKRVNDINRKITHGISFVFMTDPHFSDNDLLSKPSMKHVLDNTSIPFVICGGDFPGAFGSKDDVLKARDEVLDYQSFIGKGRFFSVQGNHDFTIRSRSDGSTGYTAENSLVYDTLIRPNEFYLSSIQAGKEYYYIDIPSQNTRIFMLNSMDGNPEAENTDAWGTQYTISQAQADWLVEKAKEKSGWKFVFVCHVPCDSNIDSYHPNEEYFHKVAAAINGKQQLAFHAQNINEDADFTDTTNQVVTILAGHNHVDQASAKDGVLSITTASDARYGDSGWVRQRDSYTSQAFDVVSIDYDRETIDTVRIGAGQDRTFSYGSSNQGEKITSLKLQPIADMSVNGTANCVVDMATPVVPQATKWSNKCFAWTTSNSAVADVDRFGKITAHSSGTVTITVSTRDGRYSDHCTVSIK